MLRRGNGIQGFSDIHLSWFHITLSLPCGEQKNRIQRMKYWEINATPVNLK